MIKNPWIQTLDDKVWYPLNPQAKDINISVIARVLSRTPRFSGHTREFYSVAQHSCLVADLVDRKDLKLHALLHDAHEVYSGYGDVASPVKTDQIKEIEVNIDIQIALALGIKHSLFYHPDVKNADLRALFVEAANFFGPSPIPWPIQPPDNYHFIKLRPMTMKEAEQEFMDNYFRYITHLEQQNGNNNE